MSYPPDSLALKSIRRSRRSIWILRSANRSALAVLAPGSHETAAVKPASSTRRLSRAEKTPENYQRYLVNGLREAFEFPGTPIRLQFRGTENPYAPG